MSIKTNSKLLQRDILKEVNKTGRLGIMYKAIPITAIGYRSETPYFNNNDASQRDLMHIFILAHAFTADANLKVRRWRVNKVVILLYLLAVLFILSIEIERWYYITKPKANVLYQAKGSRCNGSEVIFNKIFWTEFLIC